MADVILKTGFVMMSIGLFVGNSETISIPILLVIGGATLMYMASKGEHIE